MIPHLKIEIWGTRAGGLFCWLGPQRLKPLSLGGIFGTAEAVPLSKAVRALLE